MPGKDKSFLGHLLATNKALLKRVNEGQKEFTKTQGGNEKIWNQNI